MGLAVSIFFAAGAGVGVLGVTVCVSMGLAVSVFFTVDAGAIFFTTGTVAAAVAYVFTTGAAADSMVGFFDGGEFDATAPLFFFTLPLDSATETVTKAIIKNDNIFFTIPHLTFLHPSYS